ncbi:MAG TPA: glycosyltransferase family 4 protein [Verrucomicrobiae bacterium]|jgi:glycosyltransferase involved in cell wall biosynthesis|nr:glycosyltransferase family 4 protein [Verrucomicrobiae bacterium]
MTSQDFQQVPNKYPSICLVSYLAYGALTGGRSGHIGGVEWQTTLFAKWLAQKGYRVSFLCLDEGGPQIEVIDGVRIIKTCGRFAGIKGLRYFHPKWTGLVRAMRQADADIYYHNSCECVTGQIAMWCRLRRRPFVFSSQCDTDFDPKLPCLETALDRSLYRYGLRHADVRVVQTEAQRVAVDSGFGLDAVVIPMPCPEAENFTMGELESRPKRVLWIARLCKQKRPDRLLDLAEACPDIQFDLVGPVYPDSYAREVFERAKKIQNVTVHGPVPRERVPELYKNATCLCSTSDFEGFPNTFLEAWSHGLPVVSTFDPDALIATKNLGIIARTVPELQAALRSVLRDPNRYRELSQNGRRYFVENHRADMVLPKFEQVFLKLVKGSKETSSLKASPQVPVS